MRVEESTIGENQEIDSQNTEYPAIITQALMRGATNALIYTTFIKASPCRGGSARDIP